MKYDTSDRTSADPPNPIKIPSIQILRALAATIVVIEHSFNELRKRSLVEGEAFIPGPFGVEIFFVISGFIIYHVSSRKVHDKGFLRRFFMNRIIRIVPLYWIFTCSALIIILVSPEYMKNNTISFAYVLSSFFFIPFPRPNDGAYVPVLALGWSLNYEVFFYFLFGVLMIIRVRSNLMIFTTAIFILVIMNPLFRLGPIEYWTRPYLLEFIAGMWLARFYPSYVLRSAAFRFSSIFAGLFALLLTGYLYSFGNYDINPTVFAVARISLAISIVFLFLAADETFVHKKWFLPVFLGDASYSVYLSHPFWLGLACLIISKMPLNQLSGSMIYFVIFLTVTSLIVGSLIFVLIERPIGKYIKLLDHRVFSRNAGEEHRPS